MILAGCMLVSLAISDAKAFWIGGYGAYPDGGDVKNNDTGYGLEAGGRIDDTFSLEVSGTHFSDTIAGMDVDVTTLAVTGLAGVDVIKDTARLYVGAGLDYNMFNSSADILEIAAASKGMSVDQYATANGTSGAALRSILQSEGFSADVRFQDSVGYHVCAGTVVNLNEGFQIFAQYRYTWAKVKGDISFTEFGQTTIEKNAVDADYKFGLLMAGINIIL